MVSSSENTHECGSIEIQVKSRATARCVNTVTAPGSAANHSEGSSDMTNVTPRVYRKRAIPEASRRGLALRYGCTPGDTIPARCPCGVTGKISWFRLSSGKPGAWVHFSGLHIDHIHPERHGGSSTPDNLQLLCARCNRKKGARV